MRRFYRPRFGRSRGPEPRTPRAGSTRVQVGLRADLNVIDLAGLELPLPEVAHDLPTGARRIVQRARGYRATLCGGEVTFRDGQSTGARPAGLIRAARA